MYTTEDKPWMTIVCIGRNAIFMADPRNSNALKGISFRKQINLK